MSTMRTTTNPATATTAAITIATTATTELTTTTTTKPSKSSRQATPWAKTKRTLVASLRFQFRESSSLPTPSSPPFPWRRSIPHLTTRQATRCEPRQRRSKPNRTRSPEPQNQLSDQVSWGETEGGINKTITMIMKLKWILMNMPTRRGNEEHKHKWTESAWGTLGVAQQRTSGQVLETWRPQTTLIMANGSAWNRMLLEVHIYSTHGKLGKQHLHLT